MVHVELVEWDLDGVLVDTYLPDMLLDIQVISEFTEKTYSTKEYQKKFDPSANWLDHYAVFGITKRSRQLAALTRFYDLEEKLDPVELTPGAIQTIEFIDELGIPQHLVTRHSRWSILNNKLEKTGLDKYFTPGKKTITGRNKTKYIISICDHYRTHRGERVSRRETFFVTDTGNDIRRANQAEVLSIAVSHPASYDNKKELEKAGPWRLVDGLYQFQSLFLDRE
jgi:phosphoglycolate phosphatase-like HAD superfamily hydrolase